MDQQNQNPATPRHVPTEEEIARLEAEAAEALRRGEPIRRREPLPEGAAPEEPLPGGKPVRDDFVPYVDDVPDPVPAPKPAAKSAPAEEADEDDDDEEYIPGKWEKRIDALTPEQWKRWQIIGGSAVGLLAVASLFVFGQELATYGLLVAILLAMLLPRYLERAWRRKLSVARKAMVIAMVVGLVIVALILGIRTGFRFTNPE